MHAGPSAVIEVQEPAQLQSASLDLPRAKSPLHSFSNLYRSEPGKKVFSGWLEANALQLSLTAAHPA